MGHLMRWALGGALLLSVGACSQHAGDGAAKSELSPELTSSSMFGDAPAKIWIAKAKKYYRNGNYGLAERYYRKAVEEDQNNGEAWLGLAASYDRLRRFDHAERAYKVVMKLIGETPTVLNNLGYHYMLRGDLQSARQTLEAAQAKAPNNPYIANNIQLLESWRENSEKKAG